jgi:GNAT superfamily N-acetyltransferase
VFRQEGEYWVIAYQAPAFRLKDRIGLRYLAMLLGDPGREFLAVDLPAAVHTGHDGAPSFFAKGDDVGGLRVASGYQGTVESRHVAGGGPLEYFDAQARREYAQRLRDLHAASEEAAAMNDRERVSRIGEEMDFLTDELHRGLGLGRRARTAGSPIERARVSVTRAIRAALHAIADQAPALGAYLTKTIKTGTFCSYSPDRHDAVTWRL